MPSAAAAAVPCAMRAPRCALGSLGASISYSCTACGTPRTTKSASARVDSARKSPIHQELLEALHYPIDAGDQRAHIIRLNRGEGSNAEAVALQRTVWIYIHDAVRAQHITQQRRINL